MIIYIIGTGVMGSAIAKALAKKGQRVFVHDKTYSKAKALAKNNKVIADKSFSYLSKADIIILAVKPYQMADLASRIKGVIEPDSILISIAAGLTIKKLQKFFKRKKILRMMPNLGLSVGQGIAGWKAVGLSKADKLKAKMVIKAFTENFELKKELQINSVAAISGSGPAYFFSFAQGLEEAARNLGFSDLLARQLVEKTLNAVSILQRNHNYSDLINQVASKKGTTLAALGVFKQNYLNKIILKAVKAAVSRAKEISNE